MNFYRLLTLVGAMALISGLSFRALADAPNASTPPAKLATAYFAGGCFWCMEPPFDGLDGVVSTTSGYMGGQVENPTYKQVSAGGTGHYEIVRVIFDSAKVGYDELLNVFWQNIDPLDSQGQFCDKGEQYLSAIFYHDTSQRAAAERSKRQLEQSDRFESPIVTRILAAEEFYAAEEYHQNYYQKNPLRYKYYRGGCGRDKRLGDLWGRDS